MSKKKSRSDSSNDDRLGDSTIDLALPASTSPENVAEQYNAFAHNDLKKKNLTVIFSTYHSIEVISKAQKQHGLPEIDLIVCDEAHRTTGKKLAEETDETAFVRVHENSFIKAKKRPQLVLYVGDCKKPVCTHDIF